MILLQWALWVVRPGVFPCYCGFTWTHSTQPVFPNVHLCPIEINAGENPFIMNEEKLLAVGQPLRRKEDLRLLRGEGRFTDDQAMPDQVWSWLVRSPHPHAKILSVDNTIALGLPGVLAVLTGQDCLNAKLKPFNHSPIPATKFDVKLRGPQDTDVFVGRHHLLPSDKVRFVGEAVAMVVAKTREQAFLAAQAVQVDYEVLPFVVDSEVALEPNSPLVWDELHSNVFVDSHYGSEVASRDAFAKAAHVVSLKTHVQRVTAVTMEPRAALGYYDGNSGQYTLYAGSGSSVRQKQELAHVLGIEPQSLRVLSLDVGGNFGSRNRAYVEFGLVLWASRLVGRAVKFRADRSESFLSDYQGRDLVVNLSLAMDAKGRFLALKADNISNAGFCSVSLSPLSKGAGLITGNYDIATVSLRARAVFTNTMATQAYRSSGRPEISYAIERLIDKAAHELGFDRLALRRLNLVRPQQMPYTNAMGLPYDSGEYEANMDKALALGDWAGAQQRRLEAQSRGRLLGVGFANYVESSIGAPGERVDLIVLPDRIEVVIGTQSAGQGHETSFTQVCADVLHVPFEQVFLIAGDTLRVSAGGGTHAGRSLRHASAAMGQAAKELIDKGKDLLGHILALSPDQIQYDQGVFSRADQDTRWTWFELARELKTPRHPGLADDFRVRVDHVMDSPVFPNGACTCEVEIDPETGGITITRYAAVDDVGRCINPMIVHGQTHGGIAQGVGQALWEECVLDPESGQPISSSLMDYGMPRFDNLPDFQTQIVEVLSPTNPLGIKAGGEGGTTPALAVITSAVEDALRPMCGEVSIDMPITPLKVWTVLQAARKAQGAFGH